jgi:hypothetical protein
MAAAVLSACTPAGYCNRLEQFGRAELLRIGTDGSGLAPTTAEAALGITAGSIAQQALQLALDGFVTFEFTMAADTNTAGVFNLTTKGVDFLTTSCTRRVGFECLVKADVDAAFLFQESIVACAATPIVYNPAITVDPAGTATSIRSIGAGDLTSTAVTVPTAVLSVSTADVILTLTGVTNIDTTWVVKVKVYPKVAHALVPTT